MSARGGGLLSIKRKRPGSGGPTKEATLTPDERAIYNLIRSKGDKGIWKGDIRRELNIPNAKAVDNSIKSLQLKQMIKEVPDFQAKGKKRLMAMEFEPSKELTGGAWYQQGMLDKDLIDALKKLSIRAISKQRIATVDGIRHHIKMSEAISIEVTPEQIKEILDNLILEKEIVKVKSNGLGEFSAFPINADCYKLKPRSIKVGAFASIPCGVCPRINQCSPNGIISPTTCVYYNKWLEF